MNVGNFIYADDIILLAPSIESRQNMLWICEKELVWLDMSLKPKKSFCMRFGLRYNVNCSRGTVAEWLAHRFQDLVAQV